MSVKVFVLRLTERELRALRMLLDHYVSGREIPPELEDLILNELNYKIPEVDG